MYATEGKHTSPHNTAPTVQKKVSDARRSGCACQVPFRIAFQGRTVSEVISHLSDAVWVKHRGKGAAGAACAESIAERIARVTHNDGL